MTRPATLPSLAVLRAHQGRQVLLCTPEGEAVAATLRRAGVGIAMSPRFHCYTAEFMLAPGRQLPQAVYRLQIGPDSWPLLMAPVGFAPGRCGLLEVVIHTDQDQPELASHE
ncbi:MAG: hypothetical protein HY855_02035 [Burkholderiales bacterium]|nr:hypothetical protein [Burkholderiales bacterium]